MGDIMEINRQPSAKKWTKVFLQLTGIYQNIHIPIPVLQYSPPGKADKHSIGQEDYLFFCSKGS